MEKVTGRVPPPFQLGYVPKSIEASINFWTKSLGVGPFFAFRHVPYDAVTYRGEPTHVDSSVYIAYWGDVQIELVEQHNDGPSVYREWPSKDYEGLHHLCYTVDDIDSAVDDAVAAGGRIEQRHFLTNGGIAYVDFGGGPGTLVEIFQPLPQAKPLFEMMKAESSSWDGSEPIRAVAVNNLRR